MALIDNFVVTPTAKSMSNNTMDEELGARSNASMNVGMGARVNSDSFSNTIPGVSAFISREHTGSVNGLYDSFNALDKHLPEIITNTAGINVPIGSGSVELSRDRRELPTYGAATNDNNIAYNNKDGHYIGGYFGDDGYKGAYAGYQINPNTSVSGNINLDPTNKVSYALIQLRHGF
jgi:hypothetical protein